MADNHVLYNITLNSKIQDFNVPICSNHIHILYQKNQFVNQLKPFQSADPVSAI